MSQQFKCYTMRHRVFLFQCSLLVDCCDITMILSNETKEQRRCFSEKMVPRVLNVYRIYSLNNLELPESFLRLSVLPELNKQVFRRSHLDLHKFLWNSGLHQDLKHEDVCIEYLLGIVLCWVTSGSFFMLSSLRCYTSCDFHYSG